MKELLLGWTPGRHDDVAGSGVTIGAVVLRPFEPDHISDERHQRAARISIAGIYSFTWTLVFVNIEQKGCVPFTKRRSDEPPILMSFLHRGPLPTVVKVRPLRCVAGVSYDSGVADSVHNDLTNVAVKEEEVEECVAFWLPVVAHLSALQSCRPQSTNVRSITLSPLACSICSLSVLLLTRCTSAPQ